MWTLTVRSPSNSPVEYELQPGRYVIGRNPENHIVHAVPQVHGILEATGQYVQLLEELEVR